MFDFNAPQSLDLSELAASADLEAGLAADHFFVEHHQQQQAAQDAADDDQLEAYGRGEIPLEDLIAHSSSSSSKKQPPISETTNRSSSSSTTAKPSSSSRSTTTTKRAVRPIVLPDEAPVPVPPPQQQQQPLVLHPQQQQQPEPQQQQRPSSPRVDPRAGHAFKQPSLQQPPAGRRLSVLPVASAPLPQQRQARPSLAPSAPVPRARTPPVVSAPRARTPPVVAAAAPRARTPPVVAAAAPRARTPPVVSAPRARTPPVVAAAAPRARTPPVVAAPRVLRPVAAMQSIAGPTRAPLHAAAATRPPAVSALPAQHTTQHQQYAVKSQAQIAGRSQQPGYLTPTEASKSSYRNKFTPPPRASTPPPGGGSRPSSPMPLTTPRTPQLATRARRLSGASLDARPATSEELELARIAKEKHALQQRKLVERQQVERASLVGSAAALMPPTQPQPFNLRVDSRLGARPQQQQQPQYRSTMEISSHVLQRESKCWVEPHVNPAALSSEVRPFVLASDGRLRGSAYKTTEEMEWERVQHETAEEQRVRELRDQQRFDLPQHQQHAGGGAAPRAVTQPEPFHLEGLVLHEQAQRALEERVQREREAERERHNFHALKYDGSGAYVTSTSASASAPPPMAAVTTNPRAPQCVNRAQAAEEQRRQRVEREQRERAEQHGRFHARALPGTTYSRGFVPTPSQVPLVEPKDPQLKSQARSVGRHEFEARKREMDRERERDRQARLASDQAAEQERVKALRKSLVHHARPVPATSSAASIAYAGQQQQQQPRRRPSVDISSTPPEFGGARTIPEHDEDDDLHLHQPIARRLRSSSSLGGTAHRVSTTGAEAEEVAGEDQ